MSQTPDPAKPAAVFQDGALGRSPLGGKKTARVDVRITDETKFDLARKCHELGISESDFVCTLIESSLYGMDHVLKVQRDRLLAVRGLAELPPTNGS